MFPPQGYKILKPPDAYVPIRTPARKLMATPTPGPGQTPLYGLPQEQRNLQQVWGRAWVRAGSGLPQP